MKLKIENLYITLFWWIILVLILFLDQEKVVVTNLLLFSYLIWLTYSTSVEDILNQKNQLITELLVSDITKRFNLLTLIEKELYAFSNNFNYIIWKILGLFISNILAFFKFFLLKSSFLLRYNFLLQSKLLTLKNVIFFNNTLLVLKVLKQKKNKND